MSLPRSFEADGVLRSYDPLRVINGSLRVGRGADGALVLAAAAHVLCTVALLSAGLAGLDDSDATRELVEGRLTNRTFRQLAARIAQQGSPSAAAYASPYTQQSPTLHPLRFSSQRDMLQLAELVAPAADIADGHSAHLTALSRVVAFVNRHIEDAVGRFGGHHLLPLLVAIAIVAQGEASD